MSKADIIFKNFVYSYRVNKITTFVAGQKKDEYWVILTINAYCDKKCNNTYHIEVSKEDYEALLKEDSEEINLDNEVGVKSNKVEIISSLLDQLSPDELREFRRILNEKIALLEVLEGETK